ncbi:transcription antitermination factor NusB [uncultured Sphingomonas sp.]|uniref:RsmB/NOP family class I SAM-dependent RNA methyltransferase n=1 Tax=uncultured Sphingomonas sp. TaxID=158754 RepID=UPI0025F830CC|nr:transcription antitermination factor NusB [uncultured Sphingomonas sp.]
MGTAARRAAIRLLDAVLRRGEPLEAALASATRALPGGPDRGLAHAIAAETLRRLPDLDALIDSATKQRLPDDAKARFALRIALVQVLALGTPPHAAISTVLPLVDGGPRKLVHGVFSTITKSGVLLPEIPALPDATEARWEENWGEEMVEAAAYAIAAPPPLDLTLADPSVTQEWAEQLGGVSLLPGHVRLPSGSAVMELQGFDEGAWWVQDLAASIPARLLGEGRGHVLDLCAAPGGKTLQLAAAGWTVTAIDQSESRLARLAENLERTNQSAEIVAADLREWAPKEPVDAILVDAPCSASGIFRRHPDVLYRVRPAIIAEMAELQRVILTRAADWLKPGGTLVYATCSLEPEEGERQIEAFLAERPDYALSPITGEWPGITEKGTIRTLPTMLAKEGRLDGFFIAMLQRKG